MRLATARGCHLQGCEWFSGGRGSTVTVDLPPSRTGLGRHRRWVRGTRLGRGSWSVASRAGMAHRSRIPSRTPVASPAPTTPPLPHVGRRCSGSVEPAVPYETGHRHERPAAWSEAPPRQRHGRASRRQRQERTFSRCLSRRCGASLDARASAVGPQAVAASGGRRRHVDGVPGSWLPDWSGSRGRPQTMS
jgi:hypothetical protein